MQGDKIVIQHLNQILKIQLTAINQYFLHSRMCGDWGFKAMEKTAYKASIHEMKFADEIIKRILFLEGLPGLQGLGRLRIGENIPEILNADLKLAGENIEALKETITYCETAGDYLTRDILDKILHEEEEYFDWLETQIDLVPKTGSENYLQSLMED
jgi:bacterioferritin